MHFSMAVFGHHTLNNSFLFSGEVSSLFISIPFVESIGVAVDLSLQNLETSWDELKQIFKIFFIFLFFTLIVSLLSFYF